MPSYQLEIVITAKDAATRSLERVSNSLADIAKIAVGAALGYGLTRIAQGIANAGKEAIRAAADLQTFTVAVETLTAQNAVAAGAFDTVSEALKNIGPNSAKVIRDLRELSMLSPFDFRQVSQAWRLSAAYGAGSEMATKLTKAILDTGAALGLSTEMLQRLNYNLSQALVVGDLTYLNLRQLKLVGLDLARVFQSQLGMSIEEVRNQLKSGQITLREVSEAFLEYTEKNFGGAAQRMTRTFQGVMSNLKDLFFFTATDLLTPALEQWTGVLTELFDASKRILDSGVLRVIGEDLGKLTGVALDVGRAMAGTAGKFARDFLAIISGVADESTRVLSKLPANLRQMLDPMAATGIDVAESFSSAFENRLAAAAANAFNWGVNIVTQLAIGLIKGAVTVLVAAMRFIGSILAAWLGPGSPPLVAPELPEWGAAAFTEFLKGFADAEWEVLDSVSDALETALRTFIDLGAIAEDEFGPVMAAITQDLVEALSQFAETGVIGEAIFEDLIALGDQFGSQLSDLLRKQVDLIGATRDYEAATSAFEAATKAEKDAEDAVDKLTAKYNELIATRAAKRDVRAAKAELDAAKDRLNVAKDEKSAAERARDEAKERVDLLRQQVRWQEKLVDLLAQMNSWLKKNAEEAAGGGAGGRGGAGGGAGAFPGFGVPDFDQLTAQLEGGVGGISPILAGLRQRFIDTFEEIKAAVTPDLQELGKTWEWFKGLFDRAVERVLGGIGDKLHGLIPDNLVENIGKVAGAFLTLKAALAIGKIIGGIALALFGLNLPMLGLIIAGGLLLTAWENNWGGIRDKVNEVVAEMGPKFQEIKDWLDLNIPKALDALKAKWDEIKPVLWDAWALVLGNTIKDLRELIELLEPGIKDAWEAVKGWWNASGFKLFSDIAGAIVAIGDALQRFINLMNTLSGLTLPPIPGLPALPNWGQGPPETPRAEPGESSSRPPGATQPKKPVPGIPVPGEFVQQQRGGVWRRGGPAWLHGSAANPEGVIPLGSPIGVKALSKALQQAGAGGVGSIYIANITLPGVTNAESFLEQLQRYSIPNRAVS